MNQQIRYNTQLIESALQSINTLATPAMLTNLDVIVRNCLDFKRAMPDVALNYAIKAFRTPEIIAAIAPHVDGYDVASVGEIQFLLDCGISPDLMHYSNPVKSEANIIEAYGLGIRRFAFQSESELTKLTKHARESEIYVRMDVGDSESFVPLSDKFGCSEDEAMDLLVQAAHSGFSKLGITFHVGSQLLDVDAWEAAIVSAGLIAKSVRAYGVEVSFINIGGGFSAKYYTSDPDIEASSNHINPAIKKLSEMVFYAEPGRYIVANSSVLVSTVIGVEQRGGHTWVYMDVGKYQAFLGADRYDHFPYKPLVVNRHGKLLDSHIEETVTLTGPTCDSQDIIIDSVSLPASIGIGDKMIFPNMGAYTLVYGSAFNGFDIPNVHYISNKEHSA